jgi:translation initiation factor 5A
MCEELDDYDFSGTDAGASLYVMSEAGQIRVGGYMNFKDHPCKISAVSHSKTGKHGSAKCNFTGIDIFTGKKYEEIAPSSETVHVPVVSRKEYGLMDISEDDFCTLMNVDGDCECREDIKLPDQPEGFAREIRQKFEDGSKSYTVVVLSAMGHEQIMSIKEDQEGK